MRSVMMPVFVAGLVGACYGGAAATSSTSASALSADEMAKTIKAVSGLEASNPADLVGKIIRATGEVAIADPACAKKVRDYPLTAPADRGQTATEILATCHFDCPRMDVLAHGSATPATVAADCNTRHADPVGAAGAKLPAADYVVLRDSLQVWLDRIDATATPEAVNAAKRLRAVSQTLVVNVPSVEDVHGTVPLDAAPAVPVDAGPPSQPTGRISVSAKRALDVTTLAEDAVLGKVQAAYMSALKRCYREALAADPSLRGKLELAFTVDASGVLTSPTATGVSPVDACAASAMSGWRFAAPQTQAGAATTARFEITLQLVPE